MNKSTNNCVARVLNTNAEQIVSIYRKEIKLTQVSNYKFHVYTFIRFTICEILNPHRYCLFLWHHFEIESVLFFNKFL